MLASPYSNLVHSSRSHHSHSGCQLTRPASSLSLARFAEDSGHIERGRVGSCASSQTDCNERDVQHMSQNSPVTSSNDAPRAEDRSPADGQAAPLAPGQPGSNPLGEQDPVRSRSVSLHPSVPVEPPLDPTQGRPVRIDSILNPPAKAAAGFGGNPSTGEGQVAESHRFPPSFRRTSSPTDPSGHRSKRPSLSPGTGQRHILTPVAPSARLVGGISRNLPHAGIGALHSPLGADPRVGLHSATPGTPSLPDPAQPRSSVSLHSTPTFQSRRISAGPVTNPGPYETSPVPQSFSHFGRSSPPYVTVSASHAPPPSLRSPLYRPVDPLGRHPVAGAWTDTSRPQGKIPYVLDLKSASSVQAAKRKANSEASKRFRNRQKIEEQMEKKVAAQQDEIRKQAQVMQRQAEEIRALLQERDYYRSERNFYREEVSRTVPPAQMPVRPPSPQSFRLSFEAPAPEGVDVPRPSLSGVPGPAGPATQTGPPPAASVPSVPQSWPSALPQYSAPPSHEPGTAQDDQPARSLPPLAGTWTRP